MCGIKLGERTKRTKEKARAKARSLATHTTGKKKRAKEKEKAKAKVKESLTKEKEKLTKPNLQLTKVRANSSFPKANNGAAYASKRGILHKLAGGIKIPTSSRASTRKEQLGQQASKEQLGRQAAHKLTSPQHLGLHHKRGRSNPRGHSLTATNLSFTTSTSQQHTQAYHQNEAR